MKNINTLILILFFATVLLLAANLVYLYSAKEEKPQQRAYTVTVQGNGKLTVYQCDTAIRISATAYTLHNSGEPAPFLLLGVKKWEQVNVYKN